MHISDWAFSEAEEAAARRVAVSVAADRHDESLPLYDDAVAIDGPLTVDRDDAIRYVINNGHVTIEAYVPYSTRYIPIHGTIDKAALARASTIYLGHNNYPMQPRSLCDDALSLNAGRPNPAIKISTRINIATGATESIRLERCRVAPKNMTYEDVSVEMRERSSRYTAWSKTADALKSFREKRSGHIVLPTYDPETGVFKGEDGVLEYVAPRLINAYNIVQEAMITTNVSCAALMDECFEHGVFRIQHRTDVRAQYIDAAGKHASLGVPRYTHVTSPNRRYSDVLVQRHLETLLEAGGGTFEWRFDEPEHIRYPSPYDRAQKKEMLAHVNKVTRSIRELCKRDRKERFNPWLEDMPEDGMDKPQDLDPVEFSNQFKGALLDGQINEAYAQEIAARIEGKGGSGKEYALVPRDVVNLFRFAPEHGNNPLWGRTRDLVLAQLATRPSKLDEMFEAFIAKIGGKYHVSHVSFVSKSGASKKHNYHPTASAVVARYEGADHTTREFAIGFDEKNSSLRAKLEFMRSYATSALVKSKAPRLPSDQQVYVARKLHLENAALAQEELLGKGYRFATEETSFSPARGTLQPRGFKFEMQVMDENDHPIVFIAVKKDTLAEAKRIGLEIALEELRRRSLIPENGREVSGLTTFTGRLTKNASARSDDARIKYGVPLRIAPRNTDVMDISHKYDFIDAVRDSGYQMTQAGTVVEITQASVRAARGVNGDQAKPLAEIMEMMMATLPGAELSIRREAKSGREMLVVRNPPMNLQMLCRSR